MPSCMGIDEGNGNLCRMLHHFILLPESISGRVAHMDVRLKFPLDAPGDKNCIRCHGHTSLVNLCNKIVLGSANSRLEFNDCPEANADERMTSL